MRDAVYAVFLGGNGDVFRRFFDWCKHRQKDSLMIKIYYYTHSGRDVVLTVPDLQTCAQKLENLYKARIQALAFKGKFEVGAVWKNDGHLTWCCKK